MIFYRSISGIPEASSALVLLANLILARYSDENLELLFSRLKRFSFSDWIFREIHEIIEQSTTSAWQVTSIKYLRNVSFLASLRCSKHVSSTSTTSLPKISKHDKATGK
jgi:hypothetical protein